MDSTTAPSDNASQKAPPSVSSSNSERGSEKKKVKTLAFCGVHIFGPKLCKHCDCPKKNHERIFCRTCGQHDVMCPTCKTCCKECFC